MLRILSQNYELNYDKILAINNISLSSYYITITTRIMWQRVKISIHHATYTMLIMRTPLPTKVKTTKYIRKASADTSWKIHDETVNEYLKEFKIIGKRYRYPLKRLPKVFHTYVNLVQMSIDCYSNCLVLIKKFNRKQHFPQLTAYKCSLFFTCRFMRNAQGLNG